MAKIQCILREIIDLHESTIEDDFCEEVFKLETCDHKIMKSLLIVPDLKWNSKMICNGYKMILKYKEFLEHLDINIKDITAPNVYIEQQEQSVLVYENNTFILPIKFFDNSYNDIIIKDECKFVFNINYNNIYNLVNLNINKEISIPNNIKNVINLYLNNINYEEFHLYPKIINNNYDINLLPLQEVGVLFNLLNKKTLLADEMGLGKSIQALATISYTNSFPAIIVCPKSLKHKWGYECEKINNISCEIYEKNKTNFDTFDKDIYIFTYDDISKVIHLLEWRKNIKSVIFDESHYLKNKKTIRTKACLQLTSNVTDYIIETTGSPVLNKPSELISQIEVLNKIEIFGSNIDFINNYCLRENIYKKEDLENFDYDKEKEMILDLSTKMRSNFYIRRLKKDTLKQLPEKRRSFIMVDSDNETSYNKLLSEYRKEKEMKRKKQLLSKLKEVAADGKLSAIKDRINDFIENNEKVVVFAYHRKMQEKLLKIYPKALKITSDQTPEERFNNQNLFLNDPDELVIICSIKVAYYGFDLFSASQMIFAELDWVPEINRQCEDRIHRIGQKNSVNIWYIISKNTIEEKILKVNEEKMKIINEINQEIPNELIYVGTENIKNEIMRLM